MSVESVDTVDIADSGSVSDFIALLKPRVMSLAVFTSLVGLVTAPGHLHLVLAVIAMVCIAVGAGASGALNMWYEADIDARMARTAGRPIPQGRVEAGDALGFGLVLSAGSVLTLGLTVNWFAAFLLAFTIAYYVLFYTMWLKRRTVQNIVIGGAAGAFPPMVGWAAVTGGVALDSLLMFAIIFLWTPPHFWALALNRSSDYARAGVPMLPVVSGPAATRRQILLYTLLLVPAGVAPVLTGLGGATYGVVSIAAGAVFLALAIDVCRKTEGMPATLAARRLFRFSLLYLTLLFGVLLLERTVGPLISMWMR